jgi:alkyl hydroperoxide reductase subunit AhpC
MTLQAFIRDDPGPAELELADLAGGWVALAFLPPSLASSAELLRFEQLRGAFAEEDCLVVASSIDSWFELRETLVTFPVVADTDGVLARSFGAIVDGEPRFGTVLLDPDGIPRFDDLGEGASAERTLDALRRLRAAADDRAAA